MTANYGYMDGSGEYFITVNTDRCAHCVHKPCIKACPMEILIEAEEDGGEMVMAVRDDARKKLRDVCSGCKPASGALPLPCVTACPFEAVTHTW